MIRAFQTGLRQLRYEQILTMNNANLQMQVIDAYNACSLQLREIYELYSYDKHYDRLNWLQRLEPR